MKSLIRIVDTSLFDAFLKGIMKVAPDCMFSFSPDGCKVNSSNEGKTVRSFLSTSAAIGDEKVEFCLSDLTKFHKGLHLVKEEMGDESSIEMTFDGSFVACSGKVSFKLRTIRKDVIERFVSDELKTTLTPQFGFVFTSAAMNKLTGIGFINPSETPKVYITRERDAVRGEVDDKTTSMTDSISIPISTSPFGEWTDTIVTKMDMLRMWNVIGAQDVRVAMTDKKVVVAVGEVKERGFFLKSNVITSVLKG